MIRTLLLAVALVLLQTSARGDEVTPEFYPAPSSGGGGGGSGTVTSVDMTVPSILLLAGNPITTSGSLDLTLATQVMNKVWAGPTSGADATPTFRSLVLADLPTMSSANLRSLLSDESGTGAAYFQGGDIGTPSAGVLTNATGLPLATGITGFGANVATFLGTASSANLRAALTDETGTGAAYFAGGNAGTPSAIDLTNGTNLPVASGISGLGSNVATMLATFSSANIASACTNETGSGLLVFATSPALTTPDIGAATGTSLALTSFARFVGTNSNQSRMNTATTSNALGDLLLAASASTQIPLLVQGAASQSANYLQVENSAGASQFSVGTATIITSLQYRCSANGTVVYTVTANGHWSGGQTSRYQWTDNNSGVAGTADTALARGASKVVAFTDASTGGGTWRAVPTSPAQITANQNDYNPGGSSFMIRLNTDASRNITGMTFTAAQVDGQKHRIINVGSQNIVLVNESASSTAANRFHNSTGADITLSADQAVDVDYDNTTARWRVWKLN